MYILYTREAALRAPQPMFSGGRGNYTPREKYPFVFDSMEEARQSSAFIGGVKVCYASSLKRLIFCFQLTLSC